MTSHMTQVEGFNVRVVFAGDSYGRDHWATHREPEPLVEFYDARQDPTQFGPRGQFVSRYYAHTLLQREYPQGLCLDGDVPQWSVSTTGMRLVKAWLSTEIAWKSGEMPLPPYGIWTTDIDGKRVMGFTPEQMLQRDAQHKAVAARKDALLRQALWAQLLVHANMRKNAPELSGVAWGRLAESVDAIQKELRCET